MEWPPLSRSLTIEFFISGSPPDYDGSLPKEAFPEFFPIFYGKVGKAFLFKMESGKVECFQ